MSAAEKRLGDLKEFDSLFDTVAEWLIATKARVSGHDTSVPSSADDAHDMLDACQACLEELLRKQQDLDSLAVMADALCHSEVSIPRNVVELNSQHSLNTTKLKVKSSFSNSVYTVIYCTLMCFHPTQGPLLVGFCQL